MKEKYLTILLSIIVICLILLTGCGDVTYDNSTDSDALITEQYAADAIAYLEKSILTKNMGLSDLKKMFNVQCIRKTHQGYYAVLQQDDGKRAFILMDNNLRINKVIVITTIITRNEFEQVVVKGITQNRVAELDVNTIYMPYSAITVTAHIVHEGVFIVTYDRLIGDTLLENPVVSSIRFYENEYLMKTEDTFLRLNIPYILEIDRK